MLRVWLRCWSGKEQPTFQCFLMKSPWFIVLYLHLQQEQPQHWHPREGAPPGAEAPYRHPTSSAAHRRQGGHQADRHVQKRQPHSLLLPDIAHAWTVFLHTCVFSRRGQGGGAGDGHGVQPIGESAELLHRRFSAPPGPHPELRASDRHVRHPAWNEYVCLCFSSITHVLFKVN